MDDLTKSAFLNRPDLHVETAGEFAGWWTWTRDNFEAHNGPFWHRMEEDGRIRCAFRVEKQAPQRRAATSMAAAFMTFADYCLFAIAAPVLQGPAVTVSFACEFLDAAYKGELVEGTGEVDARRPLDHLYARHADKRASGTLLTLFRHDQAGETAITDGREHDNN